MTVSDFLQVGIAGVAMGSVYTLMGMGLFLTFLTSRALNFGQGDFLMLATFAVMGMMVSGVPAIVAAVLIVAGMILLGMLLERVAVRPLVAGGAGGGDNLGWVLSTMGVGMILQNIVTSIWGRSKHYPPPLGGGDKQVIHLLEAGVFVEELLLMTTCLLIVALLFLALYRTRWGGAVTTVAFDKDTAALLGIDVNHTVRVSYGVMAAVATICGLVIGPVVGAYPQMGLLYLLKGFAVICIGGFASPVGILVAGMAFGLIEAFSNYFDSRFGDLYPFLLVLILLIARPTGLFGEQPADLR